MGLLVMDRFLSPYDAVSTGDDEAVESFLDGGDQPVANALGWWRRAVRCTKRVPAIAANLG